MREDTLQRVAQYADRVLLEEHRVVTANEIKQAIGGGTDQVRAAHAAWMAELAERLRKVESMPGIPPTLSHALVAAWREVVDEAQQHATAALTEHEQKATDRVTAAEQRMAELHAVLAEKDLESNALRLRLDQREAAFYLQETELAGERAKVHAGITQLQDQKASADRAHLQMQAHLKALRDQLDTAYQRSDAQEQRYVILLEEQKAARVKLEHRLAETEVAARESTQQHHHKNIALAESNARLRTELSVTQKQHERLSQRATALEAAQHDLQLSNSLLTEKLNASQADHTQLAASIQEHRETISTLQSSLAALKAEQHVWEQIAKRVQEKSG